VQVARAVLVATTALQLTTEGTRHRSELGALGRRGVGGKRRLNARVDHLALDAHASAGITSTPHPNSRAHEDARNTTARQFRSDPSRPLKNTALAASREARRFPAANGPTLSDVAHLLGKKCTKIANQPAGSEAHRPTHEQVCGSSRRVAPDAARQRSQSRESEREPAALVAAAVIE
jgi:hypothetical protein